MLIIQCMTTPVHESIVTTFSDAFAITKASLRSSVRRDILTSTGEGAVGFSGKYTGSEKWPDFMVVHDNIGLEIYRRSWFLRII